MRFFIVLASILLAGISLSPLRAEGCSVENGKDYRFERMVATRRVNDAFDHGTIRIMTSVYRPLRGDRHEVVLFSHGSTNGQTVDPREPTALVPCSLKNYFLSRGYTLVAPARRGRGESTGTFVEECARNSDEACTPERNRELADAGLAQALADSEAVLDQLVIGKLAKRADKVILVGHSRGGFLSLALAARRPQQISRVIGFASGWLGFQPKLFNSGERSARLAWHQARLDQLGRRFRGPTLWIHADGDPLYDEATTHAFHQAFRRGGGDGAYVQIAAPGIENAHLLIQESGLWSRRVDTFLSTGL